jgi:tetratricopeptide (TPR) repeat protein
MPTFRARALARARLPTRPESLGSNSLNAAAFRAILTNAPMPQPRSLSLELVRTDGWFDRVGQTVSSFQALCDILGERFFAFSLITGVRITALTVDRRHPENTLVDFTVGGADGNEASERLPLADFQRRLVSALLLDAQHGPAPQREQDAEAIQHFIGPQYLLLAPLYGLTVVELSFESGTTAIKYEHDEILHEVSLDDFRSNLKDRVRAELSQVARQESRNAIDLGHVAQADTLFAKRDFVAVKDLLGTWPAALTIFLRTPEAQALQAETRGTLAHALGLLGSACSALGDASQAEEVLRLAVQYAGDTPVAAQIYERLGSALLAENRPGEAIGPLRRAAMLGAQTVWPRLSEAFVERGRFLAALGALEEARRAGTDDAVLADVLKRVEERFGTLLSPWQNLVAKKSA